MTKGNAVDLNIVDLSVRGYVSWDITALIKRWQNTNTMSNGMVFEPVSSTAQDVQFASKQCTTSSKRPYYILEYRNLRGISAGTDNHTQDIGRAGTGYVSDVFGGLSFARTDMSFSSSPINMTWYYNCLSGINVSIQFTSIYSESMVYYNYPTTVQVAYYILNLGDGSIKYLDVTALPEGHKALATGEQYVVDEQSGEAYIVYQAIDSDGYRYYKLSDDALTCSKYYISKDAATSSTKLLYKIENLVDEDTVGDSINIDKNLSTGQINNIIDSNGYKYVFNYTGSTISSVSYYGTGTTALSTVSYSNGAYGNLTVTFPDSKQAKYEWNPANANVLKVSNTDGRAIAYTIATGSRKYVTKIQEIATNGTTGNYIDITYGVNQTIFEDNGGNKQVENFDQYGNTVSVRDKDGNATFGIYGGNSGEGRNLLLGKSDPRRPTVNLLKNGGFEYGSSISEQPLEIDPRTGVTVTPFYAGTEQPAYSGARCFKVSCGADTDDFATADVTELTPGKFYAGSLWIKTVGENAVAQVIGSNRATTYGDLWVDSSKEIKTNGEWQYVQVAIISSLEGNAVLMVNMKNGGDFYIDNLQIEMANPANSYNFVENSDFSAGSDYWSDSTNAVANQTMAFDGDSTGTSFKLDNNRRKVTGAVGEEIYSYQQICLNGKAGDTYTFGGWACSIDALPASDANERSMSIAVVAVSDDPAVEDIELATIDYNTYINNWQFLESSFTLAEDCKNVQIRLVYNDQLSQAYFDGIVLQKEGLYKSFSSAGEIVSSSEEPEAEIDVAGSDNSNSITYNSEQDEYGNLTKATTSNGLYTMSVSNTYSANGKYKTSTTDELGNTTQYTYNEELGLLTSVEDAKENIISYLYNSMQQNTKISQTVSNPYYSVTSLNLENNYTYNSNDSLSEINTGNGTAYEFTYDIWGNPATASVGATTLATYEYTTDTERKLSKIIYANGQNITFERIEDSGVNWDVCYFSGGEENTDLRTMAYLNDFGETFMLVLPDESCVRVIDGITEQFVFGTDILAPPTILHSFGESEIENGTQFLEKIGSTGITSNYTTEGNTTLASVKINEAESQAVNQVSKTDEFGRVAASGVYQGNSVPLDNAAVVTSYSYDLPGCKTSSRVERMSVANATDTSTFYKDYLYTYDELGNILTISEGGILKARYEYDEASQLIRVDDALQNLSFTYKYDAGGNILNKKTFAYTTGTLGSSTGSIDYGYSDNNWKDKLTSYGTNAITYDASGNPDQYDGWSFVWEGGRQLKGMSKTGEDTLAFEYDVNGIRTSKTVNSTVTTFTVVGSQITRQQTGENNIYFFYDNAGQLISLNYADVNYLYIKNLQGDIVAIAGVDGSIVAEYTYDAWGNILSTTGSLAGTLGNDNPFRYRGYYYDAEIELYYLQSRYYSPEWGRFVNADGDAFIDGISIFAYCGNNPIVYFDPTGTSSQVAWLEPVLAIFVFAACYEMFGKSKGLPMISDNMNIVDCEFSMKEFRVNKFAATTISIAGKFAQGMVFSSFLIYLPMAIPALLATTMAVQKSIFWGSLAAAVFDEVFFPKSMFSKVSTGTYALFIAIFLEEAKDHSIVCHQYIALIYAATNNSTYSSLQGMWYKKT